MLLYSEVDPHIAKLEGVGILEDRGRGRRTGGGEGGKTWNSKPMSRVSSPITELSVVTLKKLRSQLFTELQ